jgi:hypothetical protein
LKKRYAKGIKLDNITMKTNAGELTVYIDSMELTDPPMVSAWMFGRKTKTISVK